MTPLVRLPGPTLPVPGHVATVAAGFQWAAVSRPHRVALMDAGDGSTATYEELARDVDGIARVLHECLRLEPNSNPDGDALVALCLSPSRDLLATILAVEQLGAAYVALDPGFPLSRIEHILSDCRPMLMVTQAGAPTPEQSYCPTMDCQTLRDKVSSLPPTTSPPPRLNTARPESVAVVLYTSGSTGIPKGVRIPHRALLNRLLWQWNTFPYDDDEVCCFKTALTFVDSLSEIFGPLLTGRSLLIIPKGIVGRTETLVRTLDTHRIGRLVLVPTLLRAILLHCAGLPAKDRLPHLRLWVCSGEPFPADLLENFFDVFANGQTICNFYGSTEVLGDVTFVEFRDLDDVRDKMVDGEVPIGSVVSNNCVYLDNIGGSDDTQTRSHGTANGVTNGEGDPEGELCVAGTSLALGYVGVGYANSFVKRSLPGELAPVLVYRTGDYASLPYHGGMLVFKGRKDGQVKVRGHRVHCSEVQRALQALPGVAQCAVLCHQPGQIQQALVGFYSSTDNSEERVEQQRRLEEELSTHLSNYMMPTLYRVPVMPLLVNGKVDRQKLLAEYEHACTESELELLIEDVSCPKEEEVARDVLGVVGRVLGGVRRNAAGPLTLSDNFFKSGGNSLNAVLAVTALKDLGYLIGLSEFLDSASLRETVMMVLGRQGVPSRSCIMGDQPTERYTCHLLEQDMEDTVVNLTATSFAGKSDLELAVGATEADFLPLLHDIYRDILLQRLSFAVKNKSGRIVASAFNFDLHAEPPMDPGYPLCYVFEFLDHVESQVRHKLPQGVGEVMHSFMMATAEDMSAKENVLLIKLMEDYNIQLAKTRKLKAVFTTNTSDATRYVCDDLLGYTTLSETPLCSFVASDGTRPFGAVPPSKVAACTVAYV